MYTLPPKDFLRISFVPTCLWHYHELRFHKKSQGVLHLTRILRTATPRAKLLVAGSGPLLERYQVLARQINPNVHFLSTCDPNGFLDKVDVFTYYSNLNNIPLAVLEAMTKGLPVLSNDIGGLNEIVFGALTRYLVKTDATYRNILSLLSQSEDECRKAGVAARKRAKDFCWKVLQTSSSRHTRGLFRLSREC